jgi:hypothetical protein
MDYFNCSICRQPYDENSRKAFMLECGHSACSKCIKFFEDCGKESFICGICCHMTKSLNIQNKAAYTKIIKNSRNTDEFEIFIRKSFSDKFSIVVKKGMTLGELKKKIKEQEEINYSPYELCYEIPLTDDSKTLESYGITRTGNMTIRKPW